MKAKLIYVALAVVVYFGARWIGRLGAEAQAKKELASEANHTLRIASTQSSQSYVWQPAGSEYEITFASTPKISERRSETPQGEVTIQSAERLSDVGFQKADYLPHIRSEVVTKDVASAAMSNFAHDYGMERFDIQFDDSKADDIVATLKGTKKFSTADGDVLLAFLAEMHWGRSAVFSAIIGAPTTEHPTVDGMALIQSIRQTD